MRDGPSAQEKGSSSDGDVEVDWEGFVLKSTEHLSCLTHISQFRSNRLLDSDVTHAELGRR